MNVEQLRKQLDAALTALDSAETAIEATPEWQALNDAEVAGRTDTALLEQAMWATAEYATVSRLQIAFKRAAAAYHNAGGNGDYYGMKTKEVVQ